MRRALEIGSNAGLLLLLLPACKGLQGPPALVVNQSIGTHYILRGVPVNERGVYQADVTTTLATRAGGSLSGTLWANADLSDETGGLFPDENGGQFTELDVLLNYSRQLGKWGWSLGYISYNFPNVALRSTSEVFSTLARNDLWLRSAMSLYLDVEEADGVYANVSVAHTWRLGEALDLDASALLGYADDDLAQLYYLTKASGLADLVATVALSYTCGEHTRITLTGAGATIVDDDLADSVEAAGLESENFRLALGLGWSF